MNKKTLTALGAFVLLAIIALVTLRQPEKGERASDHPRPIPALNPVEITTLDVTKAGATTTIKNEGGIYKVTAPVSYPADQSTAKTAFEHHQRAWVWCARTRASDSPNSSNWWATLSRRACFSFWVSARCRSSIADSRSALRTS